MPAEDGLKLQLYHSDRKLYLQHSSYQINILHKYIINPTSLPPEGGPPLSLISCSM